MFSGLGKKPTNVSEEDNIDSSNINKGKLLQPQCISR